MDNTPAVPPPPPPSIPDPPASAGPARNPWAAAAFLFGPLALWPVVLVVTGWRAGENPVLALGISGLVAAGVPAMAALAGWRWANLAGEFVCYGGMTCALISILKSGLTPEIAPAGAYFVLYAFLSHKRLKNLKARVATEPRQASASADRPLEWAKENVEAIAVAFIMALVIRCFFIEVFKIPSSSMETTLLGDSGERQGDRIMVTKFFYGLEPISRYDVVVFKFPMNPTKNFIKRVVGLPGEDLVAHRGNLYARPQGSTEPFRIQRKPLRIQRSIWQEAWPQYPQVLADKKTFEYCFKPGQDSASLTPYEGRLANNASSATCRFEAEPIQHPRGSATETDVMFAANVALHSGTGFFYVEFDTDFGKFRFVLSSTDSCFIEGAGRTEKFRMGPLPGGRTARVEFFIADGMAVALVDNRVQAELDFCSMLADAKSKPERSGLAFGSEDRQFSVSDLHVGRDVHYTYRDSDFPMSEDHPVKVPPEEYFMIGDNVPGSHDSRAWKKYTIRLENGEVIQCESQEYDARTGRAKDIYIARTGRNPDYVVGADVRGHERPYNHVDVKEDDSERAPFVPAKYIVGKALWVWWPPGRWFRLIK